MIEILFKIVISVIIVFVVFFILRWLWGQQVDVKETIMGPIKKKIDKPIDLVVTRDPNAIYQNDKIVGNVSDKVEEVANTIIFKEIYNTADFNRSIPFEYKRDKLKVVRFGATMTIKSVANNQGSQVRQNVMQSVVCIRVK